jgi:hypothetical protein
VDSHKEVRFEALRAADMNSLVFWDGKLFSSVKDFQRVGGTYYLIFMVANKHGFKVVAACSYVTVVIGNY